MAMTLLERALKALVVVSLVALLLALVTVAFAAEKKGPAIGEKMPGFTLKDFQGKEHSLSKLKGKIVVLDFSSQGCPWSRGTDITLKDIAKKYAARGIVFLGIDSHKGTSPKEIKEYADKNKIPFPILKDEGNKYADKVGATRTPEFYIVHKDGKLVYHGAYDDRKVPEKAGSVNYVTDALDNLLAGKPVAVSEMKAWGCTIKRVPKPKPSETSGPGKKSGSGTK